ncbi:MAG: group I intron-associated PD-(D/E)XK endonuclease, partial [Solirubrobacteraceae bacterium]
MLKGNDKGLIAEAAIELAAIRAGVSVLRAPEHCRYDLALDMFGRIWRVQCKWGRLSDQRDVVIVSTGTVRLTPGGYVRTTYSALEV